MFSRCAFAVAVVVGAVDRTSSQTCSELPAIERVGTGTVGTGGILSVNASLPAIGRPFRVVVTNGAPSAVGVIFVSQGEAPVFLKQFGATLYPSIPGALYPVTMDANGRAPSLFPMQNVSTDFCRARYVMQVVLRDAKALGGFAFSNGLRLTFGSLGAPMLDPTPSHTAAQSVVLSGVAASPGTKVVIEGGAAVARATAGSGGRFSSNVALRSNQLNRLFVRQQLSTNEFSPPASVRIVQDSVAPRLIIDMPEPRKVVWSPRITVAGKVGDRLSGARGITVTVNGRQAEVHLGAGTDGTFELRDLPVLRNGATQLTVLAKDVLGNQGVERLTVFHRTPHGAVLTPLSSTSLRGSVGQQIGEALEVEVRRADKRPYVGKVVTFRVVRSDGKLAATKTANGEAELRVLTDAKGVARAWWTLGSDAGCGNNRVLVTSGGSQGDVWFCATATPNHAARIVVGSGDNQAAMLGSTAAEPLRVWVHDGVNGVGKTTVTFRVVSGAVGLLTDDAEAKTETEVETNALGYAEVRALVGAASGANVVEASFSGMQGMPASFVILGRKADAQTTRFAGIVLDNSQQAVEGADCILRIGGLVAGRTKSEADGRFAFTDLKTDGLADLVVDGQSATRIGRRPIPQGVWFPHLQYEAWVGRNAENRLETPVLLPRLFKSQERSYDTTKDVDLTVDGIAGLRMIVRAGTRVRTKDGRVAAPGKPVVLSLHQVHADDVPMPFPDGIAPPFAWTLQPAGTTFDRPVEIEMPNMTGEPAGATVSFLSFDHDTHRFEVVATGRVSADASLVRSDPNEGITTSGWGGFRRNRRPPVGSVGTCDLHLAIASPFVQLNGNNHNGSAVHNRFPEKRDFNVTDLNRDDPDLVELSLGVQPTDIASDVQILVNYKGAARIRIWRTRRKEPGTQLDLPAMLSVAQLPRKLFVEGYIPAESEGMEIELTLRLKDQPSCRKSVQLTVVPALLKFEIVTALDKSFARLREVFASDANCRSVLPKYWIVTFSKPGEHALRYQAEVFKKGTSRQLVFVQVARPRNHLPGGFGAEVSSATRTDQLKFVFRGKPQDAFLFDAGDPWPFYVTQLCWRNHSYKPDPSRKDVWILKDVDNPSVFLENPPNKAVNVLPAKDEATKLDLSQELVTYACWWYEDNTVLPLARISSELRYSGGLVLQSVGNFAFSVGQKMGASVGALKRTMEYPAPWRDKNECKPNELAEWQR